MAWSQRLSINLGEYKLKDIRGWLVDQWMQRTGKLIGFGVPGFQCYSFHFSQILVAHPRRACNIWSSMVRVSWCWVTVVLVSPASSTPPLDECGRRRALVCRWRRTSPCAMVKLERFACPCGKEGKMMKRIFCWVFFLMLGAVWEKCW